MDNQTYKIIANIWLVGSIASHDLPIKLACIGVALIYFSFSYTDEKRKLYLRNLKNEI